MIRNAKEINKKLRDYQKGWFEEIAAEWIRKGGACKAQMQEWTRTHFEGKEDYSFSQPFFTGLCDYQDQSKPLVMFVGQETNGWGEIDDFKANIDLSRSQKYVCEFTYNNMITLDWNAYSSVYPNSRIYDNHYYWNFLREFKEYNIVWNELDKIHYLIKDKSKCVKLYVNDEKELNDLIKSLGKTLLQLEIETIKPDIVVFLVGNSYKRSLEHALKIQINGELSKEKGYMEIPILDTQTKYIWTYHPRYLNSVPSLKEEVKSTIKK